MANHPDLRIHHWGAVIFHIIEGSFSDSAHLKIAVIGSGEPSLVGELTNHGYSVNHFTIEHRSVEISRDDLPDGNWDLIILVKVLEHLDKPEALVLPLGQHLRTGGLLFLIAANGASPFIPKKDFQTTFKKKSLNMVLPNFLLINAKGYMGTSPLIKLFALFPERLKVVLLTLLAAVPLVNRLTMSEVFLSAKRMDYKEHTPEKA